MGLMFVKSEENRDWQSEDTGAFSSVMAAYNECMPGVDARHLKDRYFMNNHIVNPDFSSNPVFVIAFDDSKVAEDGLVAISALYVFPNHRGKGFAKLLINELKRLATPNNVVLQIAVEASKVDNLDLFYKKLDFQTTGILAPADMIGRRYQDYFWCSNGLKLDYIGNATKIHKL